MKFELTIDDKSEIANALENNHTKMWLQIKSELKFEVGDVLVKLFKRYDRETSTTKWITENIQSDFKMPQRYVYVHEDENGIGFIKPLRISDGTLGKDLLCLTDFDYRETRFQVDPEYAEHMLLDAEFDITAIRKKANEGRKVVIKMNRKLGVKPKNLGDWNNFFESLKTGDKFWVTEDYTGRWNKEYTFISKKKITIAALERENDWDWGAYRDKLKENSILLGATDTYKIKYSQDAYPDRESWTFSWGGCCVFKSKPGNAKDNETN